MNHSASVLAFSLVFLSLPSEAAPVFSKPARFETTVCQDSLGNRPAHLRIEAPSSEAFRIQLTEGMRRWDLVTEGMNAVAVRHPSDQGNGYLGAVRLRVRNRVGNTSEPLHLVIGDLLSKRGSIEFRLVPTGGDGREGAPLAEGFMVCRNGSMGHLASVILDSLPSSSATLLPPVELESYLTTRAEQALGPLLRHPSARNRSFRIPSFGRLSAYGFRLGKFSAGNEAGSFADIRLGVRLGNDYPEPSHRCEALIHASVLDEDQIERLEARGEVFVVVDGPREGTKRTNYSTVLRLQSFGSCGPAGMYP